MAGIDAGGVFLRTMERLSEETVKYLRNYKYYSQEKKGNVKYEWKKADIHNKVDNLNIDSSSRNNGMLSLIYEKGMCSKKYRR